MPNPLFVKTRRSLLTLCGRKAQLLALALGLLGAVSCHAHETRVPGWDYPFKAFVALEDAMDSKSCIQPKTYAACVRDPSMCLGQPSMGTIWHRTAGEKQKRLASLHLSVKGVPVVLEMRGAPDPLHLEGDAPVSNPFRVVARSSDGQWLVQLQSTSMRSLVVDASEDDTGGEVRFVRERPADSIFYFTLQGASLRVVNSPQGTSPIQHVTLVSGCGP